MPSLLCLLTDTVKTHSLCLGQSLVPKAHISCSFTAMFKRLTVSCLSCSVPDASILPSRCLGPKVCPSDQPLCRSQTSAGCSLCPSLQDMLHLLTKEETGAKMYLRKTVSAATLEGNRRQTAPSQRYGLRPLCSRCPPSSCTSTLSSCRETWAGPAAS